MRAGEHKEEYQIPHIQSKDINIGTYGTYGHGNCQNPFHGHGGKGGAW